MRAGIEIEVIPSGRAIGAYITGVDLGSKLTERGLICVRDALLRHSVIILRDQHLTPDDQFSFMERLYGTKPFFGSGSQFSVPDYSQIHRISNITMEGQPIGLNDGFEMWHNDTCSYPTPELFVSLYALEIPHGNDGSALGDTHWASAVAAYHALPESTKTELAGRRVRQSYRFHIEEMRKRGILTRDEDIQTIENMSCMHPVVRTHPITGRKLLYVNESYSEWIEGLEPQRSRELLEQLFAHVTQDRFCFCHSWREGDFVIWDDAATQHRGTKDYGTTPRLLHRCGSDGPAPD